jgi:hypothetical protein
MLSRKAQMKTSRIAAAFVLLLSYLGSAFHFARTAHTLETFFPEYGFAPGHDHTRHLEPAVRKNERSQSSILESDIAIRAAASRQCLFTSYLFSGSRSVLAEQFQIDLQPQNAVIPGFRNNNPATSLLLYQLAPKHSPPRGSASTV